VAEEGNKEELERESLGKKKKESSQQARRSYSTTTKYGATDSRSHGLTW
jgi:hypothetical protein